nr:putative ribonuclease h protein [Quercus suber]
MPEVAGKVKTCGMKLTKWSKKSFGSVRKMLEEKKKLLTKAELDAAKGGDLLLVSILIDKARRCWIEEAVDNNFLAHEAKLIKAIPLSLNEADNKLCWSNNVNGLYSVKAGYNLLVNDEFSSNVDASSSSLAKSSWKALWKMKTPNRIKTLLWRANSDALPTRVNLVKRKILTDPTCQACGVAQESTLHALWLCQKLNEVWSAHFSLLRSEARECSSFLEVSMFGEVLPL